jgi:hypothetical protein
MFAALRWRRWNSLMAYVVAAALAGVIVWLLYGLVVPGRPRGLAVSLMHQARGFLPLVVACSVAVSSAFWMIVRPDRFDEAASN